MKKIFYTIAAAALLVSSARAADLYQPDVIQAPPEVQVVSTNGWYLRGDAGLSINQMRGAQYWTQRGYASAAYDGNFNTYNLSKSLTIGGGAGYQFSSYLRGDVTMDYGFRSTFHGSTSCNTCTSSDLGHMTNLSLLANAYVDMGTYAGITPYVGAGVGTTYVSWDGDLNTDANGTFYHEGRNSWRFTWALMAGASVDLTCNLKADIGYRYRHVNGGSMFGPVSLSNGTDPVSTTGPGYDKGFDIHEIRGGLRYTFGDGGCGQVAYVPPAPMPVYK